jgi:hypothetical protein
MLPKDELIPVRDWESQDPQGRRWVEGYLVETQAISGLSGSPVFVRPTLTYQRIPSIVAGPTFEAASG